MLLLNSFPNCCRLNSHSLCKFIFESGDSSAWVCEWLLPRSRGACNVQICIHDWMTVGVNRANHSDRIWAPRMPPILHHSTSASILPNAKPNRGMSIDDMHQFICLNWCRSHSLRQFFRELVCCLQNAAFHNECCPTNHRHGKWVHVVPSIAHY